MNSQELKDLIDYIMENNSSKEASYILRGRQQPKCISFKFSTTDGNIFSIIFDYDSTDRKIFNIYNNNDIKKIYKWLDKER